MPDPEPIPRVFGELTGRALRNDELTVERAGVALTYEQLEALSLDDLARCDITLRGDRCSFGNCCGRFSANWNDLSATMDGKDTPLTVLDSMYSITECYDPDSGWSW